MQNKQLQTRMKLRLKKHPASYWYSHFPQSLPWHQLLPWHLHRWSHHWFQTPFTWPAQPRKMFLTWWPLPLTYDPDLQTWPKYSSTWPICRKSGPYVCPFSRERGNAHTDTQTHDVKTITPVAYAGWIITHCDRHEVVPLLGTVIYWILIVWL